MVSNPVVSNVAVSATRPGLDILERRGPAPQPTPAGHAIPPSAAQPSATQPSATQPSATQPSAVHPARTVVDSVPARESAPPLTLPADAVPAARTSAPQASASPDPAPAAGPGPRTMRWGGLTRKSSRNEALSSRRRLPGRSRLNRQSRRPGRVRRPLAPHRLSQP